MRKCWLKRGLRSKTRNGLLSGGIDRVFKPTFSKISRFMHSNPRNVSLKVVNEAATLENVGLKGVYELATLEVSA